MATPEEELDRKAARIKQLLNAVVDNFRQKEPGELHPNFVKMLEATCSIVAETESELYKLVDSLTVKTATAEEAHKHIERRHVAAYETMGVDEFEELRELVTFERVVDECCDCEGGHESRDEARACPKAQEKMSRLFDKKPTPARESVWLVLKGRELYGVASETVVAVRSTKDLALEFRHKQKDVPGEWWSIEEKKVDCDDV